MLNTSYVDVSNEIRCLSYICCFSDQTSLYKLSNNLETKCKAESSKLHRQVLKHCPYLIFMTY